jgi:hypothetical protein
MAAGVFLDALAASHKQLGFVRCWSVNEIRWRGERDIEDRA